ncbi:MAG: LysM peptidoglycan-binding domain-containing protein [Spirochaetes bacterium]|nr:LysM peptidoglycan-binding domain-containing protein [Spirochaetota bacterium]
MNYIKSVGIFLFLVAFLSSGSLFAQNLVHVVERGQTVFGIARLHNVSPDELMRFNNITDASTLQVGRRLLIPSSTAAGSQPFTEHRVVRNDTLFSIARNNGISLASLLEMNGFSQNHIIRVDDVIRVPARPGSTVPAVVERATQPLANVRQLSPASIDPSISWPVRAHAVSRMTGLLQHGVVVQGERLEPVRSLTHGTVISAGPYRGFGRVAIIEAPGGYLFVYGGFESLAVRVGDRVAPGEELGRLGIDTLSQQPNLFLIVYRGGRPVDPVTAPRA